MRPGGEGKGDEDGRGVGRVVFEGGALRGGERGGVAMEVAHQRALAVVEHAVAKDEIMHAPADIDRVDLDVAVMRDGGGDVGEGRVETGRQAGEAAGGERRDRE